MADTAIIKKNITYHSQNALFEKYSKEKFPDCYVDVTPARYSLSRPE